jgi:hypothetical protein
MGNLVCKYIVNTPTSPVDYFFILIANMATVEDFEIK